MLQRIRELAVQYANGTNDSDSQASIKAEVDALQSAIGDIASNTKFNGVALLTGGGDVDFQVGADKGQTLTVTFGDVDTSAAKVTDISTVDTAIADISTLRGTFGAAQNQLEHTVANLGVAAENLTASESRIRDLDVASEMVNFTKTQILQQAGTAILAQANSAPQKHPHPAPLARFPGSASAEPPTRSGHRLRVMKGPAGFPPAPSVLPSPLR